MSEFSESFHFAQSTRDEIANSLSAAGLKGILFGPSETGWVTFVPLEGCDGYQFLAGPYTDFSSNLSRITKKTVLEWVHAEDHMWFALLAEAGQRVAGYTGDWSEGAPTVQADAESLKKFLELPAHPGMQQQITEAMRVSLRPEDIFGGAPPAYRFAQALGLPKYQWLSSQYMAADISAKRPPQDGYII